MDAGHVDQNIEPPTKLERCRDACLYVSLPTNVRSYSVSLKPVAADLRNSSFQFALVSGEVSEDDGSPVPGEHAGSSTSNASGSTGYQGHSAV